VGMWRRTPVFHMRGAALRVGGVGVGWRGFATLGNGRAEKRKVVNENGSLGSDGERVAKVLAFQGICSRRMGEHLIEKGMVQVDGSLVKEPGTKVHPFAARFTIDGHKVQGLYETPQQWWPKLWVHHKLRNVLVTHHGGDDRGRMTLFGNLKRMLIPAFGDAVEALSNSYLVERRIAKAKNPPLAMELEILRRMRFAAGSHIVSVGRLDFTSEGLLLVTNDGGLARHLELPASKYERKYHVKIFGSVTPARLKALRHGVKVNGVLYQPVEIDVLREGRKNTTVDVTLKEGKNRELRKMFEHMGWQVHSLKRLTYGPYELGNLEKGALLSVPLKDSLEVWANTEKERLVQAYG